MSQTEYSHTPARPAGSPNVIELRLINGFRLRHDGHDIELPVCAQRVLAYLALAERPARSVVAGTLWPDASEAHASASLRSTLWRVNKVLPGIARTAQSTLSLAQSADVDVVKLRARIASTLTGEFEDGIDLLSPALNGDLLPGWDEDWILLEREYLRMLRLRAVEAMSDHLRRQGRFGAALLAAYSVIKEEPLRESAQRLAVQIHLQEGNVVEAVNRVQQFSETLRRELGTAPSPRLLAMLSEVQVGSAPHVTMAIVSPRSAPISSHRPSRVTHA